MTVLDVTYFKGRNPVKELSKADNARIIELGGDRRTGQIMIKDHSDRGILPEKDNVKNISEEEMDKLFGVEKSKPLTANQKTRVKGIVTKLKQLQPTQLHEVEYATVNDVLYLKTFLISDKRNRRGWRASWNSIKKNIKSFHGKPGIEYTKCGEYGCMLDHTDAGSYEENLHVQENYKVTTIVDTVLDEDSHTAYAIHRVENEDFAGKINRKEIKYLSPSIWPNKEKTTMYKADENDEWYIDTTDWTGVHDAWVHSPAFGHVAKIVGECVGGVECINKLKNNTTLVGSDFLDDIRQLLK